MPITFVNHYTREMIEENPEVRFIFGDNFAGFGRGGQAKACRGMKNVIGIPTKHYPNFDEDSYLTDDDFPMWLDRTEHSWTFIEDLLDEGHTIAFPTDGIGTGRAELEFRAPIIYKAITDKMAELEDIYGSVHNDVLHRKTVAT